MRSRLVPKIFAAAVAFAVGCSNDGPGREDGDDFSLGGDSDGDTGGDDDSVQPGLCVGTGSSIAVAGAAFLTALREDPTRCRVYAVDPNGNSLHVIDTNTDTSTSIEVGDQPVDLALSSDGERLYVAVLGEAKIVVVSTDTLTVVDALPTSVPPYRVAAGTASRVYYAQRDGYGELHELNFLTGFDGAASTLSFHAPELAASADGTLLVVAESGLSGAPVRRLDATAAGLPALQTYAFDGGFTKPMPERGLVLSEENNRLYFAERGFLADNLTHVRALFGEPIVAVSPNGAVVAGRERIYDGVTFNDFATRPHPLGAALFSRDARWLFEAVGGSLHRTGLATLVGVHRLGETNVPAGGLSQRELTQLVADPVRPYLYALDAKQNQIVFISRDSLLATRAEVIGSSPTDMALSPDGKRMFVATFGATEIAVLDLDRTDKTLYEALPVPSNPFRVTASIAGRIAYAEQDGRNDLRVLEANGHLVATLSDEVFQADVEFDPTGRYLYAGESSGANNVLRRYDLLSGSFVAAGVSAPFQFPGRKVIFHGGAVYYAGHKLDAVTLADLGSFGEDIVLVTPDGRFAASRGRVYDAASFSLVDGLPVDSGLLAADPDEPLLYQFDNGTGVLFLHALPD